VDVKKGTQKGSFLTFALASLKQQDPPPLRRRVMKTSFLTLPP